MQVVDGGRKSPRPTRRRSLTECEQITCAKCLPVLGVETSVALMVVLAPRRTPTGKLIAGTRVWACACCLARGVVTELARS